MKRSYEQDITDVVAVQAGDSEAWARLAAEYRPNVEKMARTFSDYFDLDEAMSIGLSALAEYVMTADEQQARFLRNQIGRVVREALDVTLHPGMSARYVAYLREASNAMRTQVDPVNDPAPLTLHAAAASTARGGVAELETYRRIESGVSVEALLSESQVDDALVFNPDFDPESVVDVLDRASTAFDADESMSRVARVRSAVAALSTRQGQVVELMLQGLNDFQIAAELGLSRSAVNAHKLRALASLREQLADLAAA